MLTNIFFYLKECYCLSQLSKSSWQTLLSKAVQGWQWVLSLMAWRKIKAHLIGKKFKFKKNGNKECWFVGARPMPGGWMIGNKFSNTTASTYFSLMARNGTSYSSTIPGRGMKHSSDGDSASYSSNLLPGLTILTLSKFFLTSRLISAAIWAHYASSQPRWTGRTVYSLPLCR